MPWLYKRGGIWWIGWRLNNVQYRKSTMQTVESEAKKYLDEIRALDMARSRKALTQDFFDAVTGKKTETITASKFMAEWLSESASVTSKSTMSKYNQIIREFSEFAEIDSKGLMMEDITVSHITGFLAECRGRLAGSTVRGYRRILSSMFLLAQNRGLIKSNPVALAKGRGRSIHEVQERKRPFTLVELKTLFDRATPFWRYMIIAGFFSGQSLGDLTTMQADAVDFRQNQITMRRRKTGKQVIIPLSKTLRDYLKSIWPKDGKGYFWPEEAERYLKTGATSFSQEFYALMSTVGLVEKRLNKLSKGKGRSAKRKAEKLGFHNIRHTFVTHLKIGGAVDSVARELAGHSSNAVSQIYTHLPNETLAKAIDQLPEFSDL